MSTLDLPRAPHNITTNSRIPTMVLHEPSRVPRRSSNFATLVSDRSFVTQGIAPQRELQNLKPEHNKTEGTEEAHLQFAESIHKIGIIVRAPGQLCVQQGYCCWCVWGTWNMGLLVQRSHHKTMVHALPHLGCACCNAAPPFLYELYVQ
jgi:hypothetical protein